MNNKLKLIRYHYRSIKYSYGLYRGLKTKFNILDIEYRDLNRLNSSLYSQLYLGDLDAIRIKSFLNKEEISKYINNLSKLKPALLFEKPFGFTHGPSLIDSYEKMDKYFDAAKEYFKELNNTMGFDFHDKIVNVLMDLSLNHVCEIPNCSGADYAFFPMKNMKRLCGSIPAHNGLMFYDMYPECRHIESLIDKSNQISILLLMQKSEKGGDLEFIDWRYCDTPKDLSTDVLRNMAMRKARKSIDLLPGDLILFHGGQLWHRVTDILGRTPRISLSAFSSFSLNHESILIWN